MIFFLVKDYELILSKFSKFMCIFRIKIKEEHFFCQKKEKVEHNFTYSLFFITTNNFKLNGFGLYYVLIKITNKPSQPSILNWTNTTNNRVHTITVSNSIPYFHGWGTYNI
jgi:hypothetical protein